MPEPDVLLNVVRVLQYNYSYSDNLYPGSQISKFKYNLLKQTKKNHTKQQNQLPAAKKTIILGASQQISGTSYLVRASETKGPVENMKLKFVFSKKATSIDEIFTFEMALTTNCQIDGEDFVNFCRRLRKHEL